jgi:hypothetical protein
MKKIGEKNKTGISNDAAIRYDLGKLQWQLLPEDAIEKIVEIYTHGALKYNSENWRSGMKWKRMIGSLKRHTKAFVTGEDIDQDSGCLHLSQIAWNAISLIWYQLEGIGEDDRFKTCKNPKLMIQCKEDIQKQIDMFWSICEQKMKEKENGKSISRR